MQIWVDADACPGAIKEILFRAAERERVQITLVANQALRIPPSLYIRSLQVPPGLDVADKRIVELLAAADLVITADIPLAAAAIDKGGHALNPRGELYTQDYIRERLSLRNFMDELRGSGVTTGGPSSLGQRDRQAFVPSWQSAGVDERACGETHTGNDIETRRKAYYTAPAGSLRLPSSLLNLKSTLNKTPNYKQQKKRREDMQKKKNEEKQRQQAARKAPDFPPPKP